MAIPPEPLNEVLPQAACVVDAEVVEVLSNGPTPPQPNAPQAATSAGRLAPSQVVRLKIKRVLRGKAPAEVVVEKPEAGYALRAGNHGPFLLDGAAQPKILGRYGPDSWSMSKLEDALRQS
ncbi:MAG: hypothetical protein JST54_24025 [Deltaproteobacteria bacterium]|nr:hypothetical protein [Deltaproteobacteria bacterium]